MSRSLEAPGRCVWGLVALMAWFVEPVSATLQDGGLGADGARAQFQQVARPGGFWATSNERYATDGSGEPDEYRMAFTLGPDGNSISGCMWAGTASANATPFWYFFHGWDPTTNSILVYQSSPGGAVAIGRETQRPDGEMEAIQTLHIPGAEPEQVRHLNRTVHPDTLDSRSFGGSGDGETTSVPRRSYVWTWEPSSAKNPC